ncbi:hypothetical protein [Streptomyces sp. NBC_01244]|uniref:hypothetical protein n=1 Tax=Streptomyces sp. NBC_01244 TaxID=2903797 RepID=UPI002E16356F|nr:hypothetical protein OG247_36975 [Streptomyces sp. NBC_01244]
MPFGRPLDMAGSPCTVSGVHVAAGRPAGLKLIALDLRDGAGLRLDVQGAREQYARAELAGHQQRLLLLLEAMTTTDPNGHVDAFAPPSADEQTRSPKTGAGVRARS